MGNQNLKMMKLIYIALIFGCAIAVNAPETLKCKVQTADGKCSACPTSGATAGGSRKLATASCATVRASDFALTTANGAEHVELYGTQTTETAYAPPADGAAMFAIMGDPTATTFICKTGYTAVFGVAYTDSKCVTNATAVTSTGGTNSAVSPYDTPATGTVGSLIDVPVTSDCARYLVKPVSSTANDLWGCFNCVPGKSLSSQTAVLTCTGSITGWDTTCQAAVSTNDTPAIPGTTICKWCASTHVLKHTLPAVAANGSASHFCIITTTATANCFQMASGDLACAICNSNAWMNGSGVCIVADPAVAAASAKILAVSALLAIIAFFN